jgi:hypothetical protein
MTDETLPQDPDEVLIADDLTPEQEAEQTIRSHKAAFYEGFEVGRNAVRNSVVTNAETSWQESQIYKVIMGAVDVYIRHMKEQEATQE